ncbi:MAG TPA: divalent-cation tolerance protein CutA [Candidatus Sumerlaeia bacterium]|nr:MAG: Divalent-cation tolerance protein CutA [candidate division BRC1 bacterium ADurb.Bin183]HRR31151.1 divalent-cation tolerance protein CutA [Candidatus Sumerlaeia bacterium]HRR99722.1 divalent-cation tolerance protein CutA [Candidatus Sumerlaeia bacterium]
MEHRIIYMTAPNRTEAEKIALLLLKERLIACANICDGIQSHYRWKGNIESASETVIIVKTVEPLVSRAIEKVKSVHPYDCPCIVSLPIQAGLQTYLNWIEEETEAIRE